MNWGDNALTAPTTPDKRLPVVDRSKEDPRLVKAAEGMETQFLEYMMKVMRQTVPKSDMDLESPATEIYRGMLDSEYAAKAAHRGGIGLADQIIAYLDAERYNLPQGQGVPSKVANGAVKAAPNREGVPDESRSQQTKSGTER
ncbi:MAG: rod-binding protein [Bdellovibrionota bacterium]